MKTGLMTHREGLCTGTVKSVSRYDIYLELITVYQYIVAPLLPTPIHEQRVNSLPTNRDFCRQLITFANSLEPDLDRQNVNPDLDPNHLTL